MRRPTSGPVIEVQNSSIDAGRRRALAFVGLAAAVTVGAPLAGAEAQSANERMVDYLRKGENIGDRLLSGQSLRAGQYLSSPDGRYAALNRASDSLFVVFDRVAKVGVWSTGVFGTPGGRVVMREDGLLVKYRAGREIWDSGTVSPEAVVLMQNNSKLVIYGKQEGRSGPLWANGELLNPAAAAPIVGAGETRGGTGPGRTGQAGEASTSGSGSTSPSARSGELPSEPVDEGETVSVRGIRVHASIADNVEALLAHAEADGIVLSGWGWRSNKRQIELRRAHCGTSDYAVYQMPSRNCSPPTARPGRSRHERGLAVDFTYQGRVISSRRSPAFIWLAANASQYGLHNLPSEPWHWSTDGN